VALALYDLLKGINRRQAAFYVILVEVGIPIAFLNALNSIAASYSCAGLIFYPYLKSRSGRLWLCCSSDCM
jgi:hypothetical protein